MEQTPDLDIKRYLRLILKRRYLFAITAACIITAAVITSHMLPPVYEASTVVAVEPSFLNTVLQNISGTLSIDDKATALSTIMRSRTLVIKVISELGVDLQGMTEAQAEDVIKNTQDKTQISIVGGSSRGGVDFFTVSFRDRDPRFARDYVNTVVGKYIETSIGSKREDSFGANTFLLDQISQFKEKVGKLNAEISALKKDKNVVLYIRFLDLQKRHEDLLIQYTEDHPEVRKVQFELEALTAKYTMSKNKLAHLSNVVNRLTGLEHELESSKKIYDQLTMAYSRSEVSTQAELQDKAGTFKIVDPAVLPITPVSPDRIKIILLGILGGLAGAAGLIVLLDILDDSIKTVDAIKSLGVPVLAVIPHIQDPRELIRSRRKDLCFYTLSGLYVMLLGAVIVMEKFGMLG